MIPVCIEVEVVSEDGGFCAEKDMLLHCVPRVGDHVQPIVDMDNILVRRVVHYCDGSILVCLEDAKYGKRSIAEIEDAFISAGCRVS